MTETSAAWYKQNAVHWTSERQALEDDLKRVFEIHQELNEEADFPYALE